MTKTRKLALLLVLAMLCVLPTGCSSEPSNNSVTSNTQETAEPAKDATQSSAPQSTTAGSVEEPSASSIDEVVSTEENTSVSKYGITFPTAKGNPSEAAEIPCSLPVTEEDVTASLYMIMSPAVIGNINQLAEENISWKTFCERTGLNLDIHLVHPGNKDTEVSLMMASQDYYDIMQDIISNYAGGGDQAIEDEVVYDLTEMIQEYAPNFWSKITYSLDTYGNVCTEAGKLVGFSRISNELLPENGLAIRKDWLDEAGLNEPTTIDELHDVLVSFQTQQDTNAALWLNGTAVLETEEILNAYYGDGDFYVKDGTVYYGPVEDSFKTYITTLAQWYDEGLIYPDFFSNTEDLRVEDLSLVASQKMGIVSTEVNKLQSLNEMIENSQWVAMGPVVAQEGDQLHTGGSFAYYAEMVDLAITTSCENPEIVCAAFDYFYTKEGALLANYGVENVTFTYDENGDPQYSEMMTQDPNSDLKTMILLNCLDIGPYLKDVYRTNSTLTDDQVSAYEIWNSTAINDQAWEMPNKVTLTSEESSLYSNYYSEFHSYYLETIAQFIIGAMDIESEWDQYVETMNTLGVPEAIELYQSAYDRYMAG